MDWETTMLLGFALAVILITYQVGRSLYYWFKAITPNFKDSVLGGYREYGMVPFALFGFFAAITTYALLT